MVEIAIITNVKLGIRYNNDLNVKMVEIIVKDSNRLFANARVEEIKLIPEGVESLKRHAHEKKVTEDFKIEEKGEMVRLFRTQFFSSGHGFWSSNPIGTEDFNKHLNTVEVKNFKE